MSKPDGIVSEKVQFAGAEKCTEMMEEGSCKETTLGDPISDRSEPIVDSSEQILDGSVGGRKLGEKDGKFGNLGSLIEEEMGKVSLAGLENDSVHVSGNGMDSSPLVDNVDTVKTDDLAINDSNGEGSSESESSTSSSSSCTGDSDSGEDDDDEPGEEEEEGSEEEKEVMRVEEKDMMGVEGEVEEGEIRDDYGHDDDDDDDDDEEEEELEEEEEEEEEGELEMIAESDYDEEDDGSKDVKGGPIRSRNETEVLPPVPPLDVTLEPHHQTLTVGVVLSILGAKVIVEGSEKHNPLTEGSILWITESRSPLGLIDEIFGPVRKPYYVVRYNSDSEVPAGIREGTCISFVHEFANHILNNNLYKKGYDASGENDEEVSEVEFSDDEKEAEYKRMVKTTKRETICQKPGNKKNNRKKGKIRDGPWRNNLHSTGVSQVAPGQDQHLNIPLVAASSPFGTRHFFAGGGLVPPPYPQMPQVAGFIPPSSGIWASGIMPCQQQQQSTFFPNGFPTDAMPWPPQNHLLRPFQMPVPNGMLFQQQFDSGHTTFPPNVILSPGQPDFFMRPSYPPWHGPSTQSDYLNQATFGTGLQGQHERPIVNAGELGVVSSGLPMGQQPPAVTQKFDQRPFFGHRKKPFHRGDGGFAGGRGGKRGRGRERGKRPID